MWFFQPASSPPLQYPGEFESQMKEFWLKVVPTSSARDSALKRLSRRSRAAATIVIGAGAVGREGIATSA